MLLFLLKLNCWKLRIKKIPKSWTSWKHFGGSDHALRIKKKKKMFVLGSEGKDSKWWHKLKKCSSFCPAYGRTKRQNLKTKVQKLVVSFLNIMPRGLKRVYICMRHMATISILMQTKTEQYLYFLKKEIR